MTRPNKKTATKTKTKTMMMTKTFREDPPKGIFENFRKRGGSWGPDLQRAGKP